MDRTKDITIFLIKLADKISAYKVPAQAINQLNSIRAAYEAKKESSGELRKEHEEKVKKEKEEKWAKMTPKEKKKAQEKEEKRQKGRMMKKVKMN